MANARAALEPSIKEYLDPLCWKIFRIMLSPKTKREPRYNELFRTVKSIIKISKPSFNEHIQHLIHKKLVKRQKKGKQKTVLCLNYKNIIVNFGMKAVEQVNQETQRIVQLMENEAFWWRAPMVISLFFAVSEMEQVKAILEYSLNPETKYETFMALSAHATMIKDMRDFLLLGVLHAKNESARRKKLHLLIDVFDQAIEETRDTISKLSSETAEPK